MIVDSCSNKLKCWPDKQLTDATQGTLKEGIPFKHGPLVNMINNYLGLIIL